MSQDGHGFPFVAPAVRVEQPLGIFYLCALPASLLLDTCYSHRLQAVRGGGGQGYRLEGAQRSQDKRRISDIGKYISTSEMAFPGTIILSANFDMESGLLIEDEEIRWCVEELEDCSGVVNVRIPTLQKVASIIDGQHRLFGFEGASEERLNTLLPCAIYLDLPKPYQAYLFATINSTQKPVDKSQTYELIGYNIEKESPESWSPDKLAVYLSRKLNSDDASPFRGRILIAAANDIVLTRAQARREGQWMVSMATVVKGINALYSSNPKRDAYALSTDHGGAHKGTRLSLNSVEDRSPLRSLYLDTNDKLIYAAVLNFFRAVFEVLWEDVEPQAFIFKTVGVQALFDVLKRIAVDAMQKKDVSMQYFLDLLAPAGEIDFSDGFFVNASGTGRSVIRTCIEIKLGLKGIDETPLDKRAEYARLCGIEVSLMGV